MSTDEDNISGMYHGADKPVPGRPLDDAILAAARDAVENPARGRAAFAGRWPAIASAAAVIVITVILVPLLKQETPQQSLPPAAEPANLPAVPSAGSADRSDDARRETTQAARPVSATGLLPEKERLAGERAELAAETEPADAAGLPGAVESMYAPEALISRDRAGAPSSAMHAADSAPFAVYTPEMWEAKISQLIAEGRLDQARAELDGFRQHYPDYPISPSLTEQLDKP